MTRLWLMLGFIVTFALLEVPAARAAISAACPDTGGTQYIVDTALDADDLKEGYNNQACALIVRTSIPGIIGENYNLKAKSVTIQGPDSLDSSKRVEIINANPSGDVLISARNGNVTITEGIVKSRDRLHITCETPAACTIDIQSSEVMTPLSVLEPGGDLRLNAAGNVNVSNATLFGGAMLHISSKTGSVLWFCPGSGDCKDPLTSGVASTLCPGGFPCIINFPTPTDLKNVCSQGTLCGGGNKEIRITAFIDVDISGSTIAALDHVTVEAKTGKILAGKKAGNVTTLTGDVWQFYSFGTQDFSDAKIHTQDEIKMEAKGGCPAPPAICINLRRADLESDNIRVLANGTAGLIDVCDNAKLVAVGGDVPRLNADSTIPYETNVNETVAECAPLAPALLLD
jgi:hypothetical protein